MVQLAEEELELVRRELSITQERLDVCSAASKAHLSREQGCLQDLDLARAEARAAQARVEDAERALKTNDCSAARRDLLAYKERAEQAEVDKELQARRWVRASPQTRRLWGPVTPPILLR